MFFGFLLVRGTRRLGSLSRTSFLLIILCFCQGGTSLLVFCNFCRGRLDRSLAGSSGFHMDLPEVNPLCLSELAWGLANSIKTLII